MKKVKSLSRALMLALFPFLTFSCSFFSFGSLAGSLSISAAVSTQEAAPTPARTVEPPALAIEVASYVFRGSGPQGRSFGPVSSASLPVVVESLLAGNWTVTVDGYSAETTPRRIATATAQVRVIGAQSTNAVLAMSYLSTGSGAVSLDISWPASIASLNGITVSLVSASGSRSASFSRSGAVLSQSEGRYSTTAILQDIPAGSYALGITFTDADGNPFGRAVADSANVFRGSVSTGTYRLGEELFPVEKPVISPAGGSFSTSLPVTMTCATPGAVIYYSKDGSPPSVIAHRYNGHFTIGSTRTVMAVAVKAGMASSDIAVASFLKRDDEDDDD